MEVDSLCKPPKRSSAEALPERTNKRKGGDGGPSSDHNGRKKDGGQIGAGSAQKGKKKKKKAKIPKELISPSAPTREMPARATRAQLNMADESSSDDSDE